jgi:hypothetical protein
LNREEDRIERELPGLRQAFEYCTRFFAVGLVQLVRKEDHRALIEALYEAGYGDKATSDETIRGTSEEAIRAALPHTDAITRYQIRQCLDLLFIYLVASEQMQSVIDEREASSKSPRDWAPGELAELLSKIEEHRAFQGNLFKSRSEGLIKFSDLYGAIEKKVRLYEARAIRIRKELEAYYGQDD